MKASRSPCVVSYWCVWSPTCCCSDLAKLARLSVHNRAIHVKYCGKLTHHSILLPHYSYFKQPLGKLFTPDVPLQVAVV